ncbi:MAG: galactokinase [Granulosicoccaceae bacterium]
MIEFKALETQFFERYGPGEVPRVFFSPGRVNLIGEHIDYHGGRVLPCGIDRGTALMIRRSSDATVKLASANFDLVAILSEDQCEKKIGEYWINYPLGALSKLREHSPHVGGFECLYSGDIPNGTGLSSSASILVVTAFAINELSGLGLSKLDIVRLAQAAENDFVGLQCGVMDQFAVTMAEPQHAMLLDCQSLEYQQQPLALGDYCLLIANSGQRRELAESGYNERFAESNQALEKLRAAASREIETLTDISATEFSVLAEALVDEPLLCDRARHVIEENERVGRAAELLQCGDLRGFGELMCASHASLRDLYAVSTPAIDALVEESMAVEGVLGSRITGAGFGGCTVSLLRRDAVPTFEQQVSQRYRARTGLEAEFLVVEPGRGVHEVLA